MIIDDSRRPPRAANWYGYSGLLPFIFALLLMQLGISPAQRALGLDLFVCYGVVILSFLGGIRWGAALTRPHWRALALSVAPSLLAVAALLLERSLAVQVLAVGFALLGLFDAMRRIESNWPLWFKRLRGRLSVTVVVMHLLVILLPQTA